MSEFQQSNGSGNKKLIDLLKKNPFSRGSFMELLKRFVDKEKEYLNDLLIYVSRYASCSISIIDIKGEYIIADHNQSELCVKFHKEYSETKKRCIRDNIIAIRNLLLSDKGYYEYTCWSGRRDVAVPIRIWGHIAAVVFFGQMIPESKLEEFKACKNFREPLPYDEEVMKSYDECLKSLSMGKNTYPDADWENIIQRFIGRVATIESILCADFDRHEINIFQELERKIGLADKEEEMYDIILKTASEITGFEDGAFSTYIKSEERVYREYAIGSAESLTNYRAANKGVTGKAIKSKEMTIISDIQSDREFKEFFDSLKYTVNQEFKGYLSRIRSAIFIPLMLRGNVYGLFSLFTQKEIVIDDHTRNRLKRLTNVVSVALSKVADLKEHYIENRAEKIIYEVMRKPKTKNDKTVFLKEVLNILLSRLHANNGLIATWPENEIRGIRESDFTFSSGLVFMKPNRKEGIVDLLENCPIRTEGLEFLLVRDPDEFIETEKTRKGKEKARFAYAVVFRNEESIKSVLAAKIEYDGKLVGVISLMSDEYDKFTYNNLLLLQEVSDDIAFRLFTFNRAEEDQRAAKHNQIYTEAINTFLGESSLQPALKSVLKNIENIGCEKGHIRIFDDDNPDKYYLLCSIGSNPGAIEPENDVDNEDLRKIIAGDLPYFVRNDVRKSDDYKQKLEHSKNSGNEVEYNYLSSLVCQAIVPIRSDDSSLYGILFAHKPTPNSFSEADIDYLFMLAGVIAQVQNESKPFFTGFEKNHSMLVNIERLILNCKNVEDIKRSISVLSKIIHEKARVRIRTHNRMNETLDLKVYEEQYESLLKSSVSDNSMLAGKVFRDDKPEFIIDVRKTEYQQKISEEEKSIKSGSKEKSYYSDIISMAVLPLKYGAEPPYGVLIIDYTENIVFDASDKILLNHLVEIIGRHYERLCLKADKELEQRRLKNLALNAPSLARELTLKEISKTAIDIAVKLVDADHGCIGFYEIDEINYETRPLPQDCFTTMEGYVHPRLLRTPNREGLSDIDIMAKKIRYCPVGRLDRERLKGRDFWSCNDMDDPSNPDFIHPETGERIIPLHRRYFSNISAACVTRFAFGPNSIGILVVGTEKPHDFTGNDIDALKTLGIIIAAAVETSKHEEREVLFETMRKIAGAKSYNDALEQMAREGARIAGCEFVRIELLDRKNIGATDNSTLTPAGIFGPYGDDVLSKRVKKSTGVSGAVAALDFRKETEIVLNSRKEILESLKNNKPFKFHALKTGKSFFTHMNKLGSLAGFQLNIYENDDRNLVGVVIFESITENLFDAQKLSLLHEFVSFAAIAIQAAQLLGHKTLLVEGLTALTDEQTFNVALKSGKMESIADRILSECIKLTGSASGFIAIKNFRTNEFIINALRDANSSLESLQVNEHLTVENGRPINPAEFDNDIFRLNENIFYSDIQYNNEKIGCFVIQTGKEGGYDVLHRGLLKALAMQSAGFIQCINLWTKIVIDEQLLLTTLFTLGAAHSIKNLLAVIYQAVSNIERESSDSKNVSKITKWLNNTIQTVRNLNKISVTLRTFPQIGDDVRGVESPEKVIEGLKEILNPTIEERNVTFNVFFAQRIEGKLFIEAKSVFHALLAVTHNAIKHSPRDTGIVTIDVSIPSENDRMLKITVSDNGPGFNEEALSKIFQPFSVYTRSDFTGTGMGLFLTNTIIKSLGGDISVRSKPGEGACIALFIPFINRGE